MFFDRLLQVEGNQATPQRTTQASVVDFRPDPYSCLTETLLTDRLVVLGLTVCI
jgi:hypothetical protein